LRFIFLVTPSFAICPGMWRDWENPVGIWQARHNVTLHRLHKVYMTDEPTVWLFNAQFLGLLTASSVRVGTSFPPVHLPHTTMPLMRHHCRTEIARVWGTLLYRLRGVLNSNLLAGNNHKVHSHHSQIIVANCWQPT
jgi:hypothetical protein